MANFCRNRFCPTVALRKESVDRNIIYLLTASAFLVALRKESVDRNYASNAVDQILPGVALRKESVDRNVNLRVLDGSKSVALRKESVDRNRVPYRLKVTKTKRRSPQGERG